MEEPSLALGDMTRKIFLCTEGNVKDVSQPVLEFLEYVAGRSVTGDFAENLESEVQRAKDKEKWRAEYMQNMAVIMDAKREGRAEGRTEGRTEGESKLAKLISFLFRDGRTSDAEKAAVDEEARKEFYRQYGIID